MLVNYFMPDSPTVHTTKMLAVVEEEKKKIIEKNHDDNLLFIYFPQKLSLLSIISIIVIYFVKILILPKMTKWEDLFTISRCGLAVSLTK